MAKKFDEMIKELYDRFTNGVVAIFYPNRRTETDVRTIVNVGQLQNLQYIDFNQRLKGAARHVRFNVTENCDLVIYKNDDPEQEWQVREPVLAGVNYIIDNEDIIKMRFTPIGAVFPFTITWYASR